MKKCHRILIYLTAAFICILLGIYIGRNHNHLFFISPSRNPISTVPQGDGKFDINTATASQLQQLPGIGKTIAQNIIDYRDENGPFVNMEDLLNVEGIGDGRLAELLEYVYISN